MEILDISLKFLFIGLLGLPPSSILPTGLNGEHAFTGLFATSWEGLFSFVVRFDRFTHRSGEINLIFWRFLSVGLGANIAPWIICSCLGLSVAGRPLPMVRKWGLGGEGFV
jgi:hypothetical protein